MAQKFACPACGASLDYDGNDPVIRCSYCGSTITVPESLRPAQQPVWTAAPPSGTPLSVDLSSLVGMATRLGEVKQLARGGQLVEATQLYQEITGVGEEEAAQVVQRLAAGESVVLGSTSTMAGTQGISGPQVAQMLAAQRGAAEQVGQRARRAVLWAVVGAVILFMAILAMVIMLLNTAPR